MAEQWPELVGCAADDAVAAILRARPGTEVPVLPAGSFVTMDYRENRVRVFVDAHGNVAQAPRVG
ncbi:serine protease inhibitor [Streptomyces subrutilus]|uniref:serine protease inhibitor n=1 Tax=Streptomyces subrutilus TaxID=36818 RepID=UPI0034023944